MNNRTKCRFNKVESPVSVVNFAIEVSSHRLVAADFVDWTFITNHFT